MADRLRLRAFGITMRFHDGGKPDVSYVQEFDQPVPEKVQQDMAIVAKKTNEANQAKGLDAAMEAKFQDRLMEIHWTGAERDLVLLFAVQEMLQQARDPTTILRALMPRGPSKFEVVKQ